MFLIGLCLGISQKFTNALGDSFSLRSPILHRCLILRLSENSENPAAFGHKTPERLEFLEEGLLDQ